LKNQKTPEAHYRHIRKEQESLLQALRQKRSRLGWIRLGVFLCTIAVSYFVFVSLGWAGVAAAAAGIAMLLWLVSRDVDNNAAIAHTERMITLCSEELDVLEHRLENRFDGAAFAPHVHAYAQDLDLFGPASLYQWLHRCHTEQGRALMARQLLEPSLPATVAQRQEAVKELAPLVPWRLELQAIARKERITRRTEEKMATWLHHEASPFSAAYWPLLIGLYTCITFGVLAATIAGYIPFAAFGFLYVIFLSCSLLMTGRTVGPYSHLNGIVKEAVTLQQLVAWIEGKKFEAPLLVDLGRAAVQEGRTASRQIRELKSILDKFDLRLSIVGLLLFNPLLLWDARQMIALNRWRARNREAVPHWFGLVAQVEVLNSLATLHFNEPGFCFPSLHHPFCHFKGTALGHPLIPAAARITNDFGIRGRGQIALVTGSNMAGKSTFLRSLGVNTVLAQMGAPVCARSLELSPMALMSSMRIADNLAENTSTFYAELKKLKTIIEAVNADQQVLILLDEILRGTNSLDRHTGSEALIRQMIRKNAVAVIATHDVALATLEKEFPAAVHNYHFDVQVAGEELFFDYRLKEGICTSLNASILMKKIGIDL